MNISFEGKVALVTGAGSGLGLATAKAFAESGASVALADANKTAVRSAADSRDRRRRVLPQVVDQHRWIRVVVGRCIDVVGEIVASHDVEVALANGRDAGDVAGE